uniref:Battenin n=1 Tax=Acrobeloides nanus TaxID=290746 RepID=A0A914CM66_9BILA
MLPSVIINLIFPFVLHQIPYGIQQFLVVTTHALSYIVIAFSDDYRIAIIGVALNSFSGGLSGMTTLALSSYYSKNTVRSYASGQGAGGLIASI